MHDPAQSREIWQRKPVLRAIYGNIYRCIRARCRPGRALEIGGGSGNFKEYAPEIVSTDIAFAPWLDAVCDAQRMPFADATFDNIVMVDVLHHIERPVRFLAEAERVLAPGGRLIFCEPAITPVSGIFYRLFHAEAVDMHADPLADGPLTPGRDPYVSNQAIPTLLAGRFRQALAERLPRLVFKSCDRFAFAAYPLSGGFRRWSLLPRIAAAPMLKLEWALRHALGRLAAFRLLAVYERRLF